MLHISFSFILLVLTISHQTANSTLTNTKISSSDMINQTCKKCTDRSSVISYSFCAASLQTVPVSRAIANLQGLALVAMELALDSASSTILGIKQLLGNDTSSAPPSSDPLSLRCLEDCPELYSDGIAALVDAMGAFLGEHYGTAGVWLSAVMEAPMTCEEGFKEIGREAVYPLENEKYHLFQLCDIALCIGRLLSSHDQRL